LHLPVVDESGVLVGVKTLAEVMTTPSRENWVVIMAGGLGLRLRPLTEAIPKPMLKVGGKPVLETILERFLACGFYNFFFSVNYLAGAIEDYFGNGSKYGVNIEYLHESEPLGTAGALSLLPERPDLPCLISNADVLTTLNYAGFLDFHHLNVAVGTMGVREYATQVPYGVIQTQGNRLTSIEEKPIRKDFVNGGVYALDPQAFDVALNKVGRGRTLTMPELFTLLMSKGMSTAAYVINEYWLDIGSPEDLRRAEKEYSEAFT
jgi:NDP-sugar pyrophosphorylase family protein